MIKLLSSLSIRYKIIVIIVSTTILAMIMWLSVYVYIDIQNYKKEMVNNISIDAKLIGEYSVVPLYFDDKKGTEEILSKLQSMSHIVSGAVYNRNKVLYASYNPTLSSIDSLLVNTKVNHVYSSNKVTVVEPILYNGEIYGYISICVYTYKMSERTNNFIIMAFISFIGVIIIAWLLANQFQKLISRPILKLSSIAKKVSIEQNYEIRIERETDDEIGFLYDSFNRMLEQIYQRDVERSVNLINLKEAKEKAENADKLKSAFLANMSHEIRTPMNSIVGFSSLLDDSSISVDDRKSFIQLIQGSCDSLLGLIDDIIDISKIEADQLNIFKANINITQILNDLHLHFTEEIKISEKKIDLIRNFDNKQLQNLILNTDANRFKQIVINLLSNALKFTDEGLISIGYEIVSEHEIKFFIKDTGIGLPPDKTDEIFDRFNKIENINKLYRGAGLGLAITKKLVNLLGGSIWVQSTLGKGSTFYFTLPFEVDAYGLTETLPINQDYTHIAASSNWLGKTILVAEDEVSNYKLIEEILKHTGVKLIWAQNGKIAIDICDQQQIDLVLMDIKMPEVDGYEATRVIKSRNASIKIISQTAYAMLAEREKIVAAGCDDYIAKPIKPIELKNIMGKYL